MEQIMGYYWDINVICIQSVDIIVTFNPIDMDTVRACQWILLYIVIFHMYPYQWNNHGMLMEQSWDDNGIELL